MRNSIFNSDFLGFAVGQNSLYIYTREKKFLWNFISSRDGAEKSTEQGRDERTQEDNPTSAKIHSRCRVVFLRSFISALFLYFFSSIPTWNQVSQKLFSLVSVFFQGFLNQPLIRNERVTVSETNALRAGENTLVL